MKTIKYSLILVCLILITSCNKYVDITPKGRSLLNTVSDLDLVMNYFSASAFNFDDLTELDNDNYPQFVDLPSAINLPQAEQDPLLTYYVPSVRKIPANYPTYDGLYSYIGAMNVVINAVDAASGDKAKGAQLKAEATIMRAYLHYLIVNVFAKAYNPATAATDGGIPYVTDNDLTKVNPKLTIAQVYANLMTDINNALPNLQTVAVSIQRPNKAFGYAVKAQVLLAMGNYADALTAATTSLTYNNNIEDQTAFIASGAATRGPTAADNLIYFYYLGTRPSGELPSIEVLNYYENGNVIRYYTNTYQPTTASGDITNSPTGDGSIYQWTYDNIYQQNSGGLTSEDVLLIQAECMARTANYNGAMGVINSIRVKRINPVDYSPLTASTEAQAMAYIMRTARIEHLYTYKNFFDIKRWNTSDAYKQTITRTINDKTFTLAPDSPLWIFPFPQSGTTYNPTLTQNY